jgi:RNA polymerase sigma factor (sigma-70 family)
LSVKFHSEELLVEGLKSKRKDAVSFLYDNYSAAINGIIKRFIKENDVAEELLQDAFIRVFTKIDLYHPEKGRLYTWMANLTRNICLDYLKSKSYKRVSNTSKGDDALTVAFKTENFMQNPETIGVNEVINKLPSELNQVIEYTYFKGYTQQEISEELDIPLGTVKTRTRRALVELRKYFN